MSSIDRDLDAIRSAMRADILPDETSVIRRLIATAALTTDDRAAISGEAAQLVRDVRAASDPGLMQSFLAEYGLSTREGVALMCLAEALLRVPDDETIDALIEDKIAPSDWGKHLGHSSSSLVNASTWALMLTGRVLGEEEGGIAGILHGAVRRLGEPVIRVAVGQAMREMGRQFVLGRDIAEALKRASGMEAKGYTYSYDMLGEAARTERDARAYHLSYSRAISAIAPACASDDIRANPGISVKLSALHPRYEMAQRARVMDELVSRTRALALLARSANMGLNIDAEEADRLDLSLDVIEAVLSDPALRKWDGFGVVVQAYGPRAAHVLDWLYALATRLDRRIMVRLVKGAYWDAEIKRAQVLGLDGFPVFTRKVATDVSYIACARKLLGMSDRIYPQFATHNAHTVAAILHMAGDQPFEFQRLHGMGEVLHDAVKARHDTRCRIYAPVGAHRDLLAYLVRRLLENGANSSFVNQIVDESVSPEEIARDPIATAEALADMANPAIAQAPELYGAGRRNATGWDLTDPLELAALDAARAPFRDHQWSAGPMIAGAVTGVEERAVFNPADQSDKVGRVRDATAEDVETALNAAPQGFAEWSARDAASRADTLRRAADLYEQHAADFFALAAREAGKTLADCVAELREAVDFLRYYASEAERLEASDLEARGVFACISPWNFPLAIFTGQIAAALAAGNAVIAKPAEQTPLIAARAVALLHEAGVPLTALQLLPGDGPTVGGRLSADPRIAGVCFTGSTETAKRIDRAMAEHLAPDAVLIAETGGLNAMIVDSTALPEQAVRDIIASSFQSAGQRCSALRCLYLQEDVSTRVLEMLTGAMDELILGDPWSLSTDVGPVIDAEAQAGIDAHVAAARAEGHVLKALDVPRDGTFVAPTIIRVGGIADLEREIFGPVLHVATFRADEIDRVIDDINATGYGLTFGLHTRIDDRVQHVIDRIRAGNMYVNRNQIGAIVGSQPFGGEGLSGTGPKAGGPHYVSRFMRPKVSAEEASGASQAPGGSNGTPPIDAGLVEAALAQLKPAEASGEAESLPGPTGESNRLSLHPRGRVLCLGPDPASARLQAERAVAVGNAALIVCPGAKGQKGAVSAIDGRLDASALTVLRGIDAICSDAQGAELAAIRRALAAREGPILPVLSASDAPSRYQLERHVCVDTTAAGGNASLMAEAAAVA
ncbi:bifunctional proline dehydrogenase/L-glutamate gamma-semialdehyde dehydrogenase PutA [Limibaculum sp. M0105]|uniref:Bifunctional protein PutA n=1 Tax=Thermohalobaculum xanthum TaxID=2753746 RepID=A0A8J7SFV0_9RHOB|nr:bifunctional proline dehydrogenase/L-glutamate gamma-semialdehyde dehydrogenase PutA [Thermohalobaculum xanthum]MBK0398675.1 bifunctional proline dehydrogenase/L-glutamate gamma-semialdehyde dehydrogenase PutA [Thermohalobaculum xanthum]